MTPTEREVQAIRLAHATARRMHRGDLSHVLPEDVEGAALLGAAKALAQWDPSRGVAFRSYAIVLIRAEIRQEMRNWDWLKRGARTQARQQAAETGEWPEWSAEPLPLDALVENLGDLPDPRQDTEAEALLLWEAGEWRRLIAKLPRACRIVFTEHYLHDLRPADICRAHGKCKNWAKMMEQYGLPRLRGWAEAAELGG